MAEKIIHLTVRELAQKLGDGIGSAGSNEESYRYGSILLVNGLLSNIDVSNVRELPRAIMLGRLFLCLFGGGDPESFLNDEDITDDLANTQIGDLVDEKAMNDLENGYKKSSNILEVDFGTE